MAATRTTRALQEDADACARLAVAAGATPGVAASMALPRGAPSFTGAMTRKRYEEVQRQAKRSRKSLIAGYNNAIEQINTQLAYSWPTISPAAAASCTPEAQREHCAVTALHCAQMLSHCASLLPDEVRRINNK